MSEMRKDKQRRSLPPGIPEQPIFGTMWIRIGTLKLIRVSTAEYSVMCQFWGEQSPAILKIRSGMPNNQIQRTQNYDIRCPVIYFVEYLKEIKNNLKLEVEGVGKVTIDITKFLNQKKQVTIDSRQAFDHFNGFFEVMGKGNRKAGSLQVQMGTTFDPQIAYRELGQQAVDQLRESSVQVCPCKNDPNFEGCSGRCICHRQNNKQHSKKQNQQIVKSNDNRIPHSLDTKQRPQGQFDPEKYIVEPNNNEQNEQDKEEKLSQLKKTPFYKQNFKNQKKDYIVESSPKQFPQIPQFLTYSGLRLDYEESKDDKPLNKQSQNQYPVAFSEQIAESERIHQINNKQLKFSSSNPDEQRKKLQKIDTPLNKIIDSLEDSQNIITNELPNQQRKKLQNQQGLFKQFYEATAGRNRQQNYENPMSPEILSRVINIDEQLMKESSVQEQINKPPLLSYDKMKYDNKQYQQNGPTFRNIPVGMPNKDIKMFTQPTPLRATNRKTGNILLLNLLIEINTETIKLLQTSNKFTIVYRPYGTKQRITTGPNFGNPITIICPVGQSEVKKMDKTPFIIQFWDSVTQKFLGILKINLSKIKKGFLLNNRLNQIAIKTNLLPTVINRGQIIINDISDVKTGQCILYAGIGTSSQLNSYLNDSQKRICQTGLQNSGNHRQNIHEIPQKDNTDKIPMNSKGSLLKQGSLKQNKLVIVDKFFGKIDSHSHQLVDQLIQLSKKKNISLSEFQRTFGEGNDSEIVFLLFRQLSDKKLAIQTINFHDLSTAFDDYKKILMMINRIFRIRQKNLKSIFKNEEQENKMLTEAREKSEFYMLKVQDLQSILKKWTKSQRLITNYLQLFSGQISLDYLESSLKQSTIRYPTFIEFNPHFINKLIGSEMCRIFCEHSIDPDILLKQLQQSASISPKAMKQYCQNKSLNCSLWMILHWYQIIKQSFQLERIQIIDPIPLSSIYNWFVIAKQNKPNDQILQKYENSRQSTQKYEQPKHEKMKEQSQQISGNRINPNDTKQVKEQQSQIKPDEDNNKQHQISKPQSVINPNISVQKQKQNKRQNIIENKQQKKPTVYRYLFSIQPVQMQIEQPLKGNCQVSYIFPFEEEQIKSKAFVTMIDKHRYPLKMYGTHGFSIQDSAQNYLADNVVKFIVRIDGRIEYEGALHADQLIIQPNTQETKVIPLFSDRFQGMAGKLKLVLQFEKGINSENTLGKQTTYQLFLPKNGYINYEISSEIDPIKIKNHLSIKEQFYIVLVFDLFHMAPNLKSIFPEISSKLYSAPKSIQLSGNIKLNLSSLILEYIKQKSAKISLNIVFYTKQKGNFERRQITYASIQLPLINVIKNQGILGDYAFKNRLGMFVTIAKCSMKYQKAVREKVQLGNHTIEKNKQSYWIILKFLELINFQQSVESLNWVKFQYILKGKKYSTEKAYLQHHAINTIRNSSILMHFSEEDFHDFKVIPITIYTNNSEKYAIDINLKAVGKQLAHQKYAVNNQYFIVVNQSSQPVKMRVGLKLYTMRGSPLLSNFVDVLNHNLDTQIFDELNMPEEIGEYQKMLNILKRNLKISTRTLDQACHELLINRAHDKLSLDFFTNRTYYKLDFTPIVASMDSQVQFISEYLPAQVSASQISQYLKENNIQLINFREEFLQRFTFKQLNRHKIDKNVDFFGFQDKVDLIAFIRKIKISDPNQETYYDGNQSAENNNQNQSNLSVQYRQLLLTILEGNNFHMLYNGIKPNAMIRIPDLGIQTQIVARNSNPFFNEGFTELIQSQILNNYKRLKVEVYHCSADVNQAQNILIGEGIISLPYSQLKYALPKSSKIIKVILNSVMSSKMKATLNIKVGLGDISKLNPDQTANNFQRSLLEDDSKWDSKDANRMGEIMHQIKTDIKYKDNLFDSSDDDY